MDLSTATFTGLMTIGFVNVVTFFKPNMDSRVKFALSLVFAFGLTFVPAETGLMILEKAKVAIGAALGVSGAYKLTQNLKNN